MVKRLVVGVVLALGSAGLYGGSIFKCDTDGGVVYQDKPCAGAGGSQAIEGALSVVGGGSGSGLYGSNQELVDRFNARGAANRAAQNEGAERYLGYQDRLRLREIGMREGELQDQLRRRGRLSVGDGIVIRQQLRGLERERAGIYYGRPRQ